MILDRIENTNLYYGISNRIKIALEYISNTDFSKLETGTYDIVKGEIFAIVNRYQTVAANSEKLEAHKKYIDVQFVYEGNELIGFSSKNNQQVFQEYDEEEDYELYDEKMNIIEFNKGMFAILFPDDLHAPGIHVEIPKDVTKVVVKVLI
jgi:YhcH/YjgK/YiaL family protein